MPKRRTRTAQTRRVERPATTLMPLIALVWMFTGMLVGYFGARVVTPENAHPTHWAITALVALLSYGVGMLWYYVRGDITL